MSVLFMTFLLFSADNIVLGIFDFAIMEVTSMPSMGFLSEFNVLYTVLPIIVCALAFGFLGAPLWLWTILGAVAVFGFHSPSWLTIVFILSAVVFNLPFLRRYLLSLPVLKAFQKFGLIPKISETERTALEAGEIWVEGELFSGKPNFNKVREEKYPQLTPREKEMIEHKVDRLCDLVDDWKFWETRELPKEAWEFIKKEKLFGMIIPESYGGLGFSAHAHSEVIARISTRSVALGVLVMVPNSLGPAELLMHYGTEAQKTKYLSRLASGDEVPCFALTEPTAGSDAGSLISEGIVFKGSDGKFYVKLNWNKRWITLAAISTLLGLAFRMRDPENLLGLGEDVGITCALIPTNTPGVVVGNRHDPLGVPFYNCPTQGKDVVVSIEDCVVGGVSGCGKGWGMLMDCLSAGRGISLPSQSAGAGKYLTRMISAHSTNRKQFGLSIGKFEGIEDSLARIVGFSYIMEACRKFTAGAIDGGNKPPVITAIAKYYTTELMRKLVNDAMDILGGAGISRGPRNVVAHGYIAAPIAITVEGANIMTRTLIIFGQGALRAHPYAYKEVAAVEKNDLNGFDKAFWGHIGHIIRNLFRSILLSLTRGRLTCKPVGGFVGRYYQKLSWASASFAILADIAMGSLGGSLKTRGKITGRFADILGWMYLSSAVLRRYEAEGFKKEDEPIIRYALDHAFGEMQKAFDGLLQNLGVPGLNWFFSGPLRWWGQFNSFTGQVSDKVTHQISKLIQIDGEQRNRLTEGIYLPKDPNQAAAKLENAFKLVKQSEGIESKIRKAIKNKTLPKKQIPQLLDLAVEKSVITKDEFSVVKRAVEARLDAIQVDDFTQDQYLKRNGF